MVQKSSVGGMSSNSKLKLGDIKMILWNFALVMPLSYLRWISNFDKFWKLAYKNLGLVLFCFKALFCPLSLFYNWSCDCLRGCDCVQHCPKDRMTYCESSYSALRCDIEYWNRDVSGFFFFFNNVVIFLFAPICSVKLLFLSYLSKPIRRFVIPKHAIAYN